MVPVAPTGTVADVPVAADGLALWVLRRGWGGHGHGLNDVSGDGGQGRHAGHGIPLSFAFPFPFLPFSFSLCWGKVGSVLVLLLLLLVLLVLLLLLPALLAGGAGVTSQVPTSPRRGLVQDLPDPEEGVLLQLQDGRREFGPAGDFDGDPLPEGDVRVQHDLDRRGGVAPPISGPQNQM